MLTPSSRPALGIAIVLLGVALPLFGASLVAVLLIERLALRRWPTARAWLGLAQPR